MINDIIDDEYSYKIIEDAYDDDGKITLELYLLNEFSDHKSIENQLVNTINNSSSSLLCDNEIGSDDVVNANCRDIPLKFQEEIATEDYIELQKYVKNQEQLNNCTPKKSLNRSSIIQINNSNNTLSSTSEEEDSTSQHNNFTDLFKEELKQIQSSSNKFQAIIDPTLSIKLWQCNLCKHTFKTKYLVQLHTKSHTNNNRTYICDGCDQGFSRLTFLQRHKSTGNCSTQRLFQCSYCLKSYSLRSSLITHHKIHFKTKQYGCTICHRSFHQQWNLNNHMNTHSNQRPYKCGYCPKGFNQMSNLTSHKEKFHSDKIDEAQKHWTCTHCSETFSKRIQLRKHELHVHQPLKFEKRSLTIIMETEPVPVNAIANNSNNTNNTFVKPPVKRKLPFTTGNKFQNIPTQSSSSSLLPLQTLPINKINPNNRRILANVGLLIPLIKTMAMKQAKENNHQMTFAVLHFLKDAPPILVRCIEYYNGKNHLLRIATKSDFLSLKTVQNPLPNTDTNTNTDNNNIQAISNNINNKISIPLIASIYQRCNEIGIMEFSIEPPQNIYQFGKSADDLEDDDHQDEKKIRLFLNAVNQQKNLQKHTVRYNNQMFKQKKLRSLLKSNRTAQQQEQIVSLMINPKTINNKLTADILPKVITIPAIPEQTNWWNQNNTNNNNTFFGYTNNNNDNDGDDAIDLSETFTNIANGNYLSPKKPQQQVEILPVITESNNIINNNAIVTVPSTNASPSIDNNNSFTHIHEINNNESTIMSATISNDSINYVSSSNNCSDTSMNNSNTFIDSMVDSGYCSTSNNSNSNSNDGSNHNNIFNYDDQSFDDSMSNINKELLLALVNAIESDGMEPDIEGIHKVFENVDKTL